MVINKNQPNRKKNYNTVGFELKLFIIAQSINRTNSEKGDKLFKVKWLIQCFRIRKKAFYKRLISHQKKKNNELILS